MYNSNHIKVSSDRQKGFSNLLVFLLLAVIAIGVYFLMKNIDLVEDNKKEENIVSEEINNTDSGIKNNNRVAELSNCGFTVTNIISNSEVSFPLEVIGVVDNTGKSHTDGDCIWQMFEGQAGLARLQYEQSSDKWKTIEEVPVTVDNWMTEKTNFSFVIGTSNSDIDDFSSGTELRLFFVEENAAAINPSDTFELPIVLE